MQRRDFLKAGMAGVGLTLAQGPSQAQAQPRTGVIITGARDTEVDLGVVVIGVDGTADSTGSAPDGALIDEYLRTSATVWQYSDNVIDFDYLTRIQSFADSHSSKIVLVKSYNDILAAQRAGKVAMVVGCQELSPLEPEWKDCRDAKSSFPNDWLHNPPVTGLSAYRDKGLLIANLAYNLANFFGGGCLDPTTPLSRAGRFIVAQMQEIGILVDCSHSSDQTTLDILKMAVRPVVCSHSNPEALLDNPRSVNNRIIEGVAKTGGLIGINTLNTFLVWSRNEAPKADNLPGPARAPISKYVDMIDYVRRLVGIDYIGIGSDFGAGGLKAPLPTKCFLYPPEMAYYQPNGLEYVKDFGRVSDLPNLRTELKRRGYSSVDIAKVCGGNWMRVFRKAWNS